MKLSIQYVDGSIDYYNGASAKAALAALEKGRVYKWATFKTLSGKEGEQFENEIYIQMDKIVSYIKSEEA